MIGLIKLWNEWRKEKKGNYSKFWVAFIILANSAFAAAIIKVFLITQAEPSALVGSWFLFTTGELWCLTKIKKAKIENAHTQNDNESEGGT